MSTPPIPPPFDPTNRNDPRYDPSRDPSSNPRWQSEQARAYSAQAKARAKAQEAAWRTQQRFAARQQKEMLRAQARQQRDTLRAYRRGSRAPSLVGPLLLIAVAVLALLLHNGRLTVPALLVWYSRWWPVLLIGFGALRLLEWAVDRAFNRNRALPGQPPVRYSLGGGVVVLVVFLAAFGVAAQDGLQHNGNSWFVGFNSDNWKHFLGSKHEQDTPSASHGIAATGALVIDNPCGDVNVSGISDDGMLHLSTHKEVFTNSDDDARERLAALEPQFSGSPQNLTLRVNGHENDGAQLTLLVPPGVRVSINANHGDVHANNLKAATFVTANHGDVDVAAITGPVNIRVNSRGKSVLARSISGPVDVEGTGDEINLSDIDGNVKVGGDFFGGGRLQHITGPIAYGTTRITFALARLDGEVSFDDHDELSASDATGPFTLKCRSRDLTLAHIAGDVNVTNSHGKVDLLATPPTGMITVVNHDGDVRLTLPQQAKFTLAADTSDGDVTSNFAVSGSNGSHGALNGTVAGGGNAVRLTTTHGDISIDHSGDASVATPRQHIPLKLGFGTVPAPPPPPGALSPQDAEALANVRQQAQEQMREAQQQTAEGRREAEQARREADQTRREALKEADQARREALQQAAEGLREADQARREAQQESGEARRQALQQADEARRQAQQQIAEAQRQADQARREALKQADEARREAQRQAEEARRQSQQPN